MKAKRSPWQIVGILLIGLLILSLITGGVGLAWYNAENPRVAGQPKAYGGNSPGTRTVLYPKRFFEPGENADGSREADPAVAEQARQFFAAFAEALRGKNAAPEPWIDTATLLILGRQSAPPGLIYPEAEGQKGPLGEAAALAHTLRTVRITWRTWDWKGLILHRVNVLAPGAFVAYTSFPKADGSRTRIAWNLALNPADLSLSITRWTDLTTGLESDHEVAFNLVSHSTNAGLDGLLLNLRSLPDAHRAMDARKADDARKQLDIAARAQATEWGRDLYELAEARYAILFGDEGLAVERLDALLRRKYAYLPALMLQMQAIGRRGEIGEVANLAMRYQAQTGPDAEALAWVGVDEVAQERPDDARATFGRALILDPHQAIAIEGLLKLTPDAERQALVDLLAKSKYFQSLFHRLVDDRRVTGEAKILELLAQAHRHRFPEDFTAARHLVAALMQQSRFDEATRVFSASIGNLAGEPREKLLTAFLDGGAGSNRQREAYDAVPEADRGAAFESAMQSWDYRLYKFDHLTAEQIAEREVIRQKSVALLELHGKTRGDDAWVLVYRAKDQNRSAAPAEAEKNARSVLDRAKPTGDSNKDHRSGYTAARSEWLMAKLSLGQTVAAFERFPDEQTFGELARECFVRSNAVELGKLLKVDAIGKWETFPMRYWRGELFWLQRDYKSCVGEMKAYLDHFDNASGNLIYQFDARDRLIRSWVRSEKAQAAQDYLKAEDSPPPLLQALALAGGNNSEEAEVFLLDAMTQHPWLAATAYRDLDLGPLLRGPAFARLREKHPPPK